MRRTAGSFRRAPYGSGQNGIRAAVQIDIDALPAARCMGASIVRRGSGTSA
jgi:hypothetical protein